MAYKKTKWLPNQTPLSADNLNNIEDGIESIETEVTSLKQTTTNNINNISELKSKTTIIDESLQEVITETDSRYYNKPIYSRNLYPLPKILDKSDPDRTWDRRKYSAYFFQTNTPTINTRLANQNFENSLYELVPKPLVAPDTTFIFGFSLYSGLFKLKERGKYTIKMFNHVSKTNANGKTLEYGFPGTVFAVDGKEKRVKWTSSYYVENKSMEKDLAIGDNAQIAQWKPKVENPLVIGSKNANYTATDTYTFEKTTDDELYFCFMTTNIRDYVVSGYNSKLEVYDITPEDIKYIYEGIMIYKGDEDLDYEPYSEEPIGYERVPIIEKDLEETYSKIEDVFPKVTVRSRNLYNLDKIKAFQDPEGTWDYLNWYAFINTSTIINKNKVFTDIYRVCTPNIVLDYSSPIGGRDDAYTFGTSLCSGWVRLTEKGKYTIKQTNQVTVDSLTWGYIGTIYAYSPADKRIKWISTTYNRQTDENGDPCPDCCTGNNTLNNNLAKPIENPLVLTVDPINNNKCVTKFTFEKTTDDELYFYWYCNAHNDQTNVAGFCTKRNIRLEPEVIKQIYEGIMIYKGDEDLDYEPYYEKPASTDTGMYIPQENVIGLKETTEKLTGSITNISNRLDKLTNVEGITLENSAKIGFFSNSFLQGYTLKGHHPVVHLNGMLDYQFYNFSKSGDDLLETLERVDKNSEMFGHTLGVTNWGLDYAVIAHNTNDGALNNISPDTFYENAKKLSNYFKGLGTIPILGTEHNYSAKYNNFFRLAKEEGYMCLDWGLNATYVYPVDFKPMAYNSHPATRTHWVWTLGMEQYFKTLPRPRKCIKIYNGRYDTYTPDNYKYDNNISRFKLFTGISGGYTALSETAAPYYDRYNPTDSKTTDVQNIKNQYLGLREGTSFTFNKNILIEFITPYTIQGIESLTMNINATYTTAYIRRVTNLAKPLKGNRCLSFGIGENDASLFPAGATLVIDAGTNTSAVSGTYTVDSVVDGIVITTTNSSGKTTSGVETFGCTVNGTAVSNLVGSYDWANAEYAASYDKPLMEWDEIELGNSITITKANLKPYIDFDKVSILLVNTDGGVTINSVSAQVSGTTEKDRQVRYQITKDITGTNLLVEQDFKTNDSRWTKYGTTSYPELFTCTTNNTYTEKLPYKCNSYIRLSKDAMIKRSFASSILNEKYDPIIQIQVMARWLPQTIFSDEDYTERNKIYEHTCPVQTLRVGIGSTTDEKDKVYYVANLEVGLWWNNFIINVPYQRVSMLSIKSESDDIDIAQIKVVYINSYEKINI